MPTEAPAKAKRERWDDWLPESDPDAHRLTLPELLQRLRDQGVKIHTHDIRHWQAEGVIPYPVKRWHDGATRALYPEETVDLLIYLRQLQAEGHSLAEIRWRLRIAARLLRETGQPIDDLNHAVQEALDGVVAAAQGIFGPFAVNRIAVDLSRSISQMIHPALDALQQPLREQTQELLRIAAQVREDGIANRIHPLLRDAATEFSSLIGESVTRVDVTFTDDSGQQHSLSVPIPLRPD